MVVLVEQNKGLVLPAPAPEVPKPACKRYYNLLVKQQSNSTGN